MSLYYVWRAKDGSLGQYINTNSGTQASQAWARMYKYLWPGKSIATIVGFASYRKKDRQSDGGVPKLYHE